MNLGPFNLSRSQAEDTYFQANNWASYDDWRRARDQWDYFCECMFVVGSYISIFVVAFCVSRGLFVACHGFMLFCFIFFCFTHDVFLHYCTLHSFFRFMFLFCCHGAIFLIVVDFALGFFSCHILCSDSYDECVKQPSSKFARDSPFQTLATALKSCFAIGHPHVLRVLVRNFHQHVTVTWGHSRKLLRFLIKISNYRFL